MNRSHYTCLENFHTLHAAGYIENFYVGSRASSQKSMDRRWISEELFHEGIAPRVLLQLVYITFCVYQSVIMAKRIQQNPSKKMVTVG